MKNNALPVNNRVREILHVMARFTLRTNLVHCVHNLRKVREVAAEVAHPLREVLHVIPAARAKALVDEAYHPVVVDVADAPPEGLGQMEGGRKRSEHVTTNGTTIARGSICSQEFLSRRSIRRKLPARSCESMHATTNATTIASGGI